MRILTKVFLSTICVFLADSARGQAAGGDEERQAAQMRAQRLADDANALMAAIAPATALTLPVGVSIASKDGMPALHIAVTQVSESRSSSAPGAISLSLGISAEGLPSNAIVRQVTVTKAADNMDGPLGSFPGRGGVNSTLLMGSMMSGAGPGTMRATAFIASSPRSADSIKFIEGTMELLVPSEATDSIIRIANIKRHYGRVESAILAKYGIDFRFMGDKESEVDARAQMSGSSSSTTPINGVTGIGYFYRDPNNKLAGVQLQDGNGVPIRTGTGTGGGGGGGAGNGTLMTYPLTTPLDDDTQLVIFVAVPEAIKLVPFRVDDIMLP